MGDEELGKAIASSLAQLVKEVERRGRSATRAEGTIVSFRHPDPTTRIGTIELIFRRARVPGRHRCVLDVKSHHFQRKLSVSSSYALAPRKALLKSFRNLTSDPAPFVTMVAEHAWHISRETEPENSTASPEDHPYTGAEQLAGTVAKAQERGSWKLLGYDTFAGEWYSLGGEFDDEAAGQRAATDRLAELERDQPSSSSGGQAPDGIQDRVYIVTPEGEQYRWTG